MLHSTSVLGWDLQLAGGEGKLCSSGQGGTDGRICLCVHVCVALPMIVGGVVDDSGAMAAAQVLLGECSRSGQVEVSPFFIPRNLGKLCAVFQLSCLGSIVGKIIAWKADGRGFKSHSRQPISL